ncbi:uncharacterized protein UTRI_05705 [Ustilago trichophora]|uniref:Uncharacterized protein n=1 Tax=Ustilago trichophora TaxID=86804 RepID=A0A5C3EL67_9BASI|nr:uncharacterized protein UTRI_05705 [Ustilago trichophora]
MRSKRVQNPTRRGRGGNDDQRATSRASNQPSNTIDPPESSPLSSLGASSPSARSSESMVSNIAEQDIREAAAFFESMPEVAPRATLIPADDTGAQPLAESSQNDMTNRLVSVSNSQDTGQTDLGLREQLHRLQQQVNTIEEKLADSQAERHAMVETLHWQDALLKRISPAAIQTATANKPSLPPLHPQRKGGGGTKPNKELQGPFRKELRKRMGLGKKDPLPPFEASPPTFLGAPVLQIDWSKSATAYTGLVIDIIADLAGKDPSIQRRIEDLRRDGNEGLPESAVDICLASLQQMMKDWRTQQRDASNPDRKLARDARQRRINRVKKKCDKRTAVLTRDEALWRQYHHTNFAIPEAASAEVTDAEAADAANNETLNPTSNETETDQNESSLQLTDRLAGLGGGASGGGGAGGASGVGGTCGSASRPRAMHKAAPCWRSLELHQALEQIDKRREANLSAQVLPSSQVRERLGPSPVTYPPLDSQVEPLPSSIERWMVSLEFARLFPTAVPDVSRNTILPESSSSTILDAEQWGQHPPYPVHRALSQSEGSNLFLGTQDRNPDKGKAGHHDADDDFVHSGRGEERLAEAGSSSHPAQVRRRRHRR